MSGDMTCAEAEPLLPLVADGALDPDSDPQLFAHLAACPTCQRAVATHDLISLALRSPAAPAPRRARILRLWPLVPVAAAAALAVAFWPTAEPIPAPASAQAPAVAATPKPEPPPAAAPATATPHVIAMTRPDGSVIYLVQSGEHWRVVDPADLDTGAQMHQPSNGVQVRY